MHVHPHPNSSAGSGASDRAGDASPSGAAARRWFRLSPTAFKPLTYSLMHLSVAITVAYALTQDWRIAVGVGVIEPMVQTVAYMAHEKVWSFSSRPRG